MKKSIVGIIGLGQLGSRHLQALSLCKSSIDIEIVDVSEKSLETSVSRFFEVPQSNNFKGKIKKVNAVSSLSNELDIVIIATNSLPRRKIIEELLQLKKVKFLILEKFLFPYLKDYNVISSLIKEKKIATWVNCPRRMMSSYKKIKSLINKKSNFFISVVGGKWNLGSNAVHFIDLFFYFTNLSNIQTHKIIIAEKTKSKRIGYSEYNGTLVFENTNKDSLVLTSNPFNQETIISLTTEEVVVEIHEGSSKADIYLKEKNWVKQEIAFNLDFQSVMTNKVVDSLIENATCELPTYEDSVKAHIPILKTFINFRNNKEGFCNIT